MGDTEDIELSDESVVEPEFVPTFQAEDLIKIDHSFGYDCKRLYNMVLIDDNTIVFASGTFLHFFNIKERVVQFRSCVYGCGIGFVTKNDHRDFHELLTVAENGANATIFIYEYPSMRVCVQLEGGAKQQFTCGSYNPSGELFASQAGYPDFMLTIWRWQKAEIVLRSKSFQNDVLQIHFSKFNPILLATCGLSHIKFWKMANTFTGLKLKGDLGRFGKTDFSDIYAIYMLSDENVISGCEWGNMLLWEAGLIKFEITRTNRKPCHTKPIVRITMKNNEVTTFGMDGYVCIWQWDVIDIADPPDNDRFVEVEPIYEFHIGDCEIRAIQKIKVFDDSDYGYYLLDGNGGIWYCDLNTTDIPKDSYKLYNCHGGRILAAQVSPVTSHLITVAEDGRLSVYNYLTKQLLLQKQFHSICTDILWFNTRISFSGRDIVAGFKDGFIRQLYFNLRITGTNEELSIALIRLIKGHSAPITKMVTNQKHNILVTGSEDCTIFIYGISEKFERLEFAALTPMGFIELGAVPCCFNWRLDDKRVILIGCKTGEVFEYRLKLKISEEQTYLSYNITDSKELKSTKFVSVKSVIRRDIKRDATKRRKDKKRKRKLMEIEKLKKNNPGLQIDMEAALADSEPEEEEDPLYIPPVPNPVLWLRHTENNTIWVSMGGYDAGYIYELQTEVPKPVKSTLIKDGDDCEIRSFLNTEQYLIFGLVNGKLRINIINPEDFTDLRNYRTINLHDPLNGIIPNILLTYDGNYLVTIGYDGNIFTYIWGGSERSTSISRSVSVTAQQKVVSRDDITDPNYLTLEQEKIYAEKKRQEEAAAAHKKKVLNEIAILQEKFNKYLEQNEKFDEDFRIPYKDMLLDERITKQIKDELQFELDDVREDLAYDLEKAQVGKQKLYDYFLKNLDHIPIKVNCLRNAPIVYSFRIEKLSEEFYELRQHILKILDLEEKRRRLEKYFTKEEKGQSFVSIPDETFFFGRDPNTIIPRFSKQMLRILNSYRARQKYEAERLHSWDKMARDRPDPNQNHPDDEHKIAEAKKNLGDYKLKTGAAYEPQSFETLAYKYCQVLDIREKIFNMVKAFNDRVFQVRQNKYDIYKIIKQKLKRLEKIHQFIPESNKKNIKPMKPVNEYDEYPEKNLIEKFYPGCGIEIDDILYLNKTVADLLPKPPKQIPKRFTLTRFDIHELETSQNFQVETLEGLPDYADIITEVNNLPNRFDPLHWSNKNETTIPWFVEKRYNWMLELLSEQDAIINEIDQYILIFDNRLHELSDERIFVKAEVDFLNCFMTCLNQELYIMRDSEQIENQLLINADEALATRNQAQTEINVLARQIDELRKNCDRFNDHIAVIQAKFLTNTKGHKFFDFLKRIFRKKWRPPKPPKTDDESSESSSEDESSTEEEDEMKSVDSTDMTTIRLDEDHCPSGLERPMYDLAFKLRSDRHELERALLDALKQIDMKREEVKAAQRNVKYHTDIYNQETETLLAFRRKRQQELNRIHVSVLLKMRQIQHFHSDQNYRDLSKAVLFDSSRLEKLKGRVGTLQKETEDTKRLHRINVIHLRRMEIDLTFMRLEIKRLEMQINEETIKKFGICIKLDELEEEVLRKYVFDLETTAEDEIRDLIKEINMKQHELKLAKEELTRENRKHVDKTNKLAILTEEKFSLEKLIEYQESNYKKWLSPPNLSWDRENEKLSVIDKEQKKLIQCLENEIANIRIKAKPLEIEGDVSDSDIDMEKTEETLPPSDKVTCPEMLQADAFQSRLNPDDFTMERCHKIVQKLFVQRFGKIAGIQNVRHYSYKVGRYLAQAAFSFEGPFTKEIMDCLVESIQSLVPKKYMIHLNTEDIDTMFRDILNVFDYERLEVKAEELVASTYDTAKEILKKSVGVLNTAQFILVEMIKQLVEILSCEELESESTINAIVDNLMKEPYFDGRCISVENLVSDLVQYSKDNLLDNITCIPIRALVLKVQKEYTKRRPSRYQINSKESRDSVTELST